MGRVKLEIKRIENTTNRQVTFSKPSFLAKLGSKMFSQGLLIFQTKNKISKANH
ncbi:BnaA09g30870D [Brassica napus]|uniref:BnaA09g30870D protein n=2 Tax=Brassica TaxID=3705 RepID=A0A078G4E8_BRANA|nr:BnaA09g30870D [Brassica napus]VDC62127.1 unnamed protein product [Brassica rapa]